MLGRKLQPSDKTDMRKQLEIYKKLHGQTGRHVCRHNLCSRLVLGDYCLDHLEAAISREWSDLDEQGQADEPPRQLPTGENHD